MEKKRLSGAKLYLSLLAGVALLCLAGALWWMLRGGGAAPEPRYLLKDDAGHLALYAADGSGPLAEYEEVYTRLLPEGDVLALQQGVPVYDETDLQKHLEDYGY